MEKSERSMGAHIEKKELNAKVAPNFRDLYPNAAHVAARTEVNAKMSRMAQVELGLSEVYRLLVPAAMSDWSVELPSYEPPELDIPRGETSFAKEGDVSHDADPSTISRFSSLEVSEVVRDELGYPLNPIGRTGLRGRGMLDKWGPTEAADPVLTRHNPDTGALEVLVIQRGDTGEWAFPGGKVDTGETPAIAAGRELIEEAGVSGIALDFTEATTVYAGYIDDSRNTDNAWMESTALHLHLSEHQASIVAIEAGSDADATRWAVVDEWLYGNFLKAHADILALALGERPQL